MIKRAIKVKIKMYFISSAFYDIYPKNKRSLFKNLLQTPLSGDESWMRIDSIHLQKKIDVIDNDIMFISYRQASDDHLTAQKNEGMEGKFALFEYSISHHQNTCILCLKFLPSYYPINEFIRTFNLFSTKYLENRVLLNSAASSPNKIMFVIRTNCEIYASPTFLRLIGMNPRLYGRLYKNQENQPKFKNHSHMLDPKKTYIFKKLRSGIKHALKPYDKTIYTPQVIKIYCDQADYSIESSKVKKLAAVLPGFSDNECQKYDYYPIDPMLVKLNGSYLNSFKFKVADEEGKQLKFSSGFATYINASIIKKSLKSEMNEEYLTVISSDPLSKQIYTKNENNFFTIHLPKTIFKGDYKKWFMSILNISIPSVSPNIYDGENTITVTEFYDKNDDTDNIDESDPTTKKDTKRRKKKNQDPNPYTSTIKTGNYKSIDDLISQISRPTKNNTKVVISVESVGLVSFVNESHHSKKITMHPNLALTLGLINEMPGHSLDILDLTLKPSEAYICKYEPDLKITENLYCKLLCEELVQTYFGNKNEEILKFLPLRNSSQQKSFFQEFQQKTRVEINSNSLNNLTFKLARENSSDLMQFENKDVATHMTLLIERIN